MLTEQLDDAKIAAKYAIGVFKRGLDEYKAKSNANTEYYQSRNQNLKDIRAYILLLEEVFVELENERQSAYNRGFQAGLARGEKIQQYNGFGSYREYRDYDREGSRDASINNARQRWPELFE